MPTPSTRCLAALGVLTGLLAQPTEAQGQFLGAWLLPQGSVRGTVALSHLNNEAWFCGDGRAHCDPGDRAVFSDLTHREQSRTTSLNFRLEYSPTGFLGLSGEIPWHSVNYERYIASRPLPIDALDATGIGDAFFTVRTGGTRDGWAGTAGYGIEIPTGDFTIDAFRVPLGQGTLNHVLYLELGRSLWPARAYVEAGVLARVRGTFTTDDGVEAHWGNELIWRVDGGWQFHAPWWIKFETKGFRSGGFSTNIPGEPKGDYRSIWVVFGSLQYELGGALAEIWLQAPVAGRNTPADPTVGFSISYTQ